MAEIKINIDNLENGIKRLETLGKNWGANDTLPPVTVGGGKVVNEFEELAKMYKSLNTHMVTLAVNTASFLQDVKDSYQKSDHEAAQNMVGD